MKNKIVELNDNENYYVLEELAHNGKKYICATKCDLEKEQVNEEEMIIVEVRIVNDKVTFNDIVDEHEIEEVTQMFLNIMKNSEFQK